MWVSQLPPSTRAFEGRYMSSDPRDVSPSSNPEISSPGVPAASTVDTASRQSGGTAGATRAGGDFYLDVERRSIKDAVTGYINRLRSGDPGALPSVLGLIVLAVIFAQVSSRFLSRNNI